MGLSVRSVDETRWGFSSKTEQDPMGKKRGDLGAGGDSGMGTLIQNHVAGTGVVPSQTAERGFHCSMVPEAFPDHSEQEHRAYLVQPNAHIHQLRVTSCEVCHLSPPPCRQGNGFTDRFSN